MVCFCVQVVVVRRLRWPRCLGCRGHVSCWRHRLVLGPRRCQRVSAGSPRVLVALWRTPADVAAAGLPGGSLRSDVQTTGGDASTVRRSAVVSVDRWLRCWHAHHPRELQRHRRPTQPSTQRQVTTWTYCSGTTDGHWGSNAHWGKFVFIEKSILPFISWRTTSSYLSPQCLQWYNRS